MLLHVILELRLEILFYEIAAERLRRDLNLVLTEWEKGEERKHSIMKRES